MIKHYCDFCGAEMTDNSKFYIEYGKHQRDWATRQDYEYCTSCYLKLNSFIQGELIKKDI